MPIILPNKTFKVFGRDVTFTDKELMDYRKDGLEIPDGSILEFFLMEADIEDRFCNAANSELKSLCEKAIEYHKDICKSAAKVLFDNPEAWDPV